MVPLARTTNGVPRNRHVHRRETPEVVGSRVAKVTTAGVSVMYSRRAAALPRNLAPDPARRLGSPLSGLQVH